MHAACEAGNLKIVSLLLSDQRISLNEVDETGWTPFCHACQKGRLDVISFLLADQRVDVNKGDLDQRTPFYLACEVGKTEVVSLLIESPRVDPNHPMNEKITPLWRASKNGHLEVVQFILASWGEINTKKMPSFSKRTPAKEARSMAARTKRDSWEDEFDFQQRKIDCLKIAEMLDEFGVDPNRVRSRLRDKLGLDGETLVFLSLLPPFFLLPFFILLLLLLLSSFAWIAPLAGELFALVIYLSDGYLKLPEA